MADSYVVGDLPFATDAAMREDYVNHYGYPRCAHRTPSRSLREGGY